MFGWKIQKIIETIWILHNSEEEKKIIDDKSEISVSKGKSVVVIYLDQTKDKSITESINLLQSAYILLQQAQIWTKSINLDRELKSRQCAYIYCKVHNSGQQILREKMNCGIFVLRNHTSVCICISNVEKS